jgi:uncharacterized membrane protein
MHVEIDDRVWPLLGAAGVGAALMFFLDPARGARRRHMVTDQLVHARHRVGDALGATQRDLRHHAQGAAAVARRSLSGEDADDIVIAERVRSALGRLTSHPGAITVTVDQGRATLSGPVLADEAERVIDGVRSVRGVREVEDRLAWHDRADGVPALQGGTRATGPRPELLQSRWSPTMRLATGLVGGALAAYALSRARRPQPIEAALGAAGLALLGRSVANQPFRRLVGIGRGRRAITVTKTINISAPIDEVFQWFTNWEGWPHWMTHVRRVSASGPRGAEGERTHWEVDGPVGGTVAWDAVTTRVVPNELVVWKTVEGATVEHSGRLGFSRNRDGSTRVQVQITYSPVGGTAGHAIAVLFGRDPKRQMDDDFGRLKTTIEGGSPPRDAAQPDLRREGAAAGAGAGAESRRVTSGAPEGGRASEAPPAP